MAKDLSNLEPTPATRPAVQAEYASRSGFAVTPAGPTEDAVEVARVWLRALGRKAEEQDLLDEPAPHRNQIIRGASEWLRAYTGDFEYLLDLQARQRIVRRGEFPTVRQAKGILNCLRSEMNRAPGTYRGAPLQAGAPATPPAPTRISVEDAGVYKLPDGTICKVQVTRDKARTYAKRLVEHKGITRATEADTRVHAEYVYEVGLVQRVAAEGQKLSLAEAKALSIRYAFCIRCGRSLKDAKSVEQGMGPVCVRYFSGA